MSYVARPRFLMCAPDFYGVEYVINPWMIAGRGRVHHEEAAEQWQGLRTVLEECLDADIRLVSARQGLPDMVFTANAGLVIDGLFIPSRFRPRERSGEEGLFTEWARSEGFRIATLPPDIRFEGAGDALFDRLRPVLWLGFGVRSDPDAADALGEVVGEAGYTVQPLRLLDPRYYHLDTCYCPLSGGVALYYPPAFADEALDRIHAILPCEDRIAVSDEDAQAFACNAVNVGDVVVLNSATDALKGALRERGFRCVETPLAEFLCAGGSAKCLTLRLDDP